jgi:hypothetical protein
MKFPVLHIPFLPMAGMAIFPFILIKKINYRDQRHFIYHEKIHLVQQLEMLLLGFYVLYFLNYVVNLLKYRNHEKAYLNIVFEREAYTMETDLSYLKKRRFWGWMNFL